MGMHKSMCGRSQNAPASCDKTLDDYLTRKYQEKKKMTFDEWLEDSQMAYRSVEKRSDLEYYLEQAWKAAQENAPDAKEE